MPHPRSSLLAALAALLLGACDKAAAPGTDAAVQAEPASSEKGPRLGLMTSLPLYWPLGADMQAIASGRVPSPWQRTVMERIFTLEPLDTLSPVPGLSPDAPETDPLAGLERLAIIQPRGLSAADNVALDDWVRRGGRLLLVLDPMLTGEYDLPLGDPRRPVDAALIPPVVARWGLAIRYDDTQSAKPVDSAIGTRHLPLILAGEVTIADPAAADCALDAGGSAARCRVGEGEVTLIADAAFLEDDRLAFEDGIYLRNLLVEILG